ncbi:MAG: hypothetical protein ACPGU1_17835 [Myxococcota bacterium]
MKDETQRIIERYLDVVQSERAEDVDQAELQAIARELGVSDDEIQAAESAAEAHVTRGRLHLEHALHDDAVREFGAAAALRPFDVPTRRGLADALVRRWESSGDRSDADLARTLALRVIEEHPDDHASYALLERLERGVPLWRRPAGRFVAVALLLSAVGASFALFKVAPTPNPPPPSQAEESTASAVVTPRPNPPVTASPGEISGEVEVTFDGGGKLNGFNFEATRSRFQRYAGGSLSYKLHAELVNDSERVLERLDLQLDLVAKDGAVLASTIKKVLGSDGPPHRPGDVLAWSHLVFDKEASSSAAQPHTLTITVNDIITQPKATYPSSKVVPFSWRINQGAFALVVRQREFRAGSSPFEFGADKGKHFHKAVLEVENQGPALKQLKVRATWSGASGTTLGTTERFVIGSLSPPLPSGKTRLYNLIGVVKGQASHVTLEAVDVE